MITNSENHKVPSHHSSQISSLSRGPLRSKPRTTGPSGPESTATERMERSRPSRLTPTLIRYQCLRAATASWRLNLGAYFNSREEEGDLVNSVLKRI
jgi:hypothetical protein